MANQVSSVDIPLDLFAGLDLELSAADVPEGVSPANNDVAFSPGRVSTRPGTVRRILVSNLGPISYQKSFVANDGTIKNLYLTQGDGILWVEDVTNSPGTAVLLFQTCGATFASSVTCSGAEYIALSDSLHGVDIPLQYDGSNVYRITQDGPAASPSVVSIALAPSQMVASSAPATTAITGITTTDPFIVGFPPYQQTIYATLTLVVADTTGFQVGEYCSISGATALNGSYTVSQVVSGTTIKLSLGAGLNGFSSASGGNLTGPPGTTLVRANNTVSCTTATPHNLQRGFQVQISGVPASIVGTSISSIVINNEDNPGIATVTTTTPHGLLPNNAVTLNGVINTTVGGTITSVSRSAQVSTIVMSAIHGLQSGSVVMVACSAPSNSSFNGTWIVRSVTNTTFTYEQVDADDNPTADAGSVQLVWPLSTAFEEYPNYFTVQTAPTANQFTIGINYTDGTWTGGFVSFAWDGIFYVTQVTSPTSFQYQQYGPPVSTTQIGTVTPYGQMAPGLHQCRVSWIYADQTFSAPSPPITFVANGGQYPSISQIPISQSPNVIGRLLQFTGAGGAFFYDIPEPAMVNGILVATSTAINDNTTSNIVLDFSDNTLYSASGDSIPGNNLSAQVVVGPCSRMFTYASRLIAGGERNKVNNLQNMGFEGGILSGITTAPLGWTVISGAGTFGHGQLVQNRLGSAWQVTLDVQPLGPPRAQGILQQTAYVDGYGAPILLPSTLYSVRVWANCDPGISTPSVNISMVSVSTGFGQDLVIPITSTPNGAYYTGTFLSPTPSPIPQDMLIHVAAAGISSSAGTVTIDDVELIYTAKPYLNFDRVSYADNFTAFDGLTGILGPQDDDSPIMNYGVIRQTLYMVTGTGLHETQDNGQTEPAEWGVGQLADNCGAFSPSAVARNAQGIGSAGKNWMIWSGPDGAQVFFGQYPIKISQEVQRLWDEIPNGHQSECWVKNDEANKRCYFGIPISLSVIVLDYRNLDGEAIAYSPPVHISFTGKMIASDLTRKWTTWTIPAYCGELMYVHNSNQPQMSFGCSNGVSYTLNPDQFHDDDFGVIPASYTTYFFVSHEAESALQLGSHRHVYTMASALIEGQGTWTVTPYMASLFNPQNVSQKWPLSNPQKFDVDFGINVETTRCAFTIQAQPIAGSVDAYFSLQKLVINMAPAPFSPTRGTFGGAF
jgi:hypothetical protein